MISAVKRLLMTLLLSSFVCFAQQGDNSIRGHVVDQLGGVILDATVDIRRDDFRATARTDREGGFSFLGLAPGRYSIRVTADDFAAYENNAVFVSAQTRILQIQLQVSRQAQALTVTADLQISREANSATMLVLQGAALEALPDNPNNLAATLQLLARAGNPQGPQFIVDGFASSRLPPKKSIREIRINQNAFSAQYDQPGLGRVEILTKPGSNTVQGGVFMHFNDEWMNTRNPFAYQRSQFQSRLYGANLSGPLIPRHASFFLDVERVENDDSAVINATVLDESLNVTQFNRQVLQPQRRTHANPRVDLRLNNSHTLVSRYSYRRMDSSNMGIGDFSLPSRSYGSGELEHRFQLTGTGILSQSLINELRLQYVENYLRQNADSTLPVLRVPEAFIGGGSDIGLSSDRRKALEVDNDMMWAKGTHAVKYGFRFRSVHISSVSPSNFGGTFTFAGRLAPQLNDDGSLVVGSDGSSVLVPITTLESYRRTLFFQRQGLNASAIRERGGGAAQFSMAAGNAEEIVRQYDLGVYLQDDWQAFRNLTLSTGLRYERQTNIQRNLDFAPRVGIAWTPSTSTDAKLVVRAGAGFFYDRISENLVLQSRRFNGISQQQYVVSDPRVLDQFPAVPAVETLEAFVVPSAIFKLSDTIRAPYMMQSTLSVERSLPLNFSASATYMYSRSSHLLRSRNVNAPLPSSGTRPIPGAGEVFQYESSGRFKQNQFVLNLTQRFGRFSYYGTYIFNRAFSDTDGPGSFPANSYDLATEWGSSSQDVRHTFYWGGWITGPFKLDITPTVVYRSGVPFNITTGRDLDGDSLFMERPTFASLDSTNDVVTTTFGRFAVTPEPGQAFIPRNFGRGPSFAVAHLKLGRTFNVTPASNSPDPSMRRLSLTLSVQIQNLFNHTNSDVPAGNLSSPLFGRPYSSVGDFGFGNNYAANRRIEAQIYFGF